MQNNTICIVSPLYPPHIGGVETFSQQLANALAKMGHHILIVTSNTEGMPSRESNGQIDIFRLPCHALLSGRYPVPKHDKQAKRCWAALRNTDIDFIVVNTFFYPISIEALAFAREKGIPPVLINHGSAHLTLGNKLLDIPLRLIEHLFANRAKHYNPSCWGISKKASKWLGHFGIESHGEIPNAIDVRDFREKSSKFDYRTKLDIPKQSLFVVFAGRLVPEKGIFPLSKAVKNLGSSIQLAIAGNGPLESSIRDLDASNIHLLGSLPRNQLAAILLQADVFCLPSRSEGFSTCLLEAAACGATIISTDIGGFREIAPTNECGILLPSAEESDIAHALAGALSDKTALSKIANNALSNVLNNYNWQSTAEAVLVACMEARK